MDAAVAEPGGQGSAHARGWSTDVRIRIRPGRADSGVKLYVTDQTPDGPRELMANTRFFRYPGLFDALIDLLDGRPAGHPLRVLIMPLSVGLEAVTFVIAGLRKGLFERRQVVVEGFDLSAKATELARGGIYPRLFFPEDLSGLEEFVAVEADGFVRVRETVLRHLKILPAADALAEPGVRPFEMVVCLNLLMHLAEADRPRLVERLAAMTAAGGILCLNNNQEWPQELAPHFAALAGTAGNFVSLHEQWPAGGEPPEFAVTDARALILRRKHESTMQ